MVLQKNVYVGEAHADGVSVRFYDSGPHQKSRETIVLLHGTGGSAENSFWALFPMLGLRHRVVSFDFVDPDEKEDAHAEHYGRQLHAVLREVQKEGCVHLVGYSFGAIIAAEFAAKHPELLDSLSLVAGWAKTDVQQRLRNDIWRSFQNKDALDSFTVFTTYSQAFLNSKNETELASLIRSISSGSDRTVKMAFNRQVDITEILRGITTPSLVVGCLQDQTAPIRHSKMLFGGLKNARYAEINAGHGVVHERPSELFTLIDAFVCDVHSTPPGHIFINNHA